MSEELRHSLEQCLDRYETMARNNNLQDLLDFIKLFRESLNSYPITKLNRWMGYIQGVLITKNITTIDIERDWTRPLFRPLEFSE